MTALGFAYFDAYLKCRTTVAGNSTFEAYQAIRNAVTGLITEMHGINKDYILAAVARDYLDRELGQAVSKHYAVEMGLINQWMMIGPFDNQGRAGHGAVYPPGAGTGLRQALCGKDGVEVGWFPYRGDSWQGLIDLLDLFSPTDWSTIYAVCYVTSPKTQDVQFRVGSNDSVKVWLGDTEVWDSPIERGLSLDDDLGGRDPARRHLAGDAEGQQHRAEMGVLLPNHRQRRQSDPGLKVALAPETG